MLAYARDGIGTIKVNYTAYCVNEWASIVGHHMKILSTYRELGYSIDLSLFVYPNDPRILPIATTSMAKMIRVVPTSENLFEFPAIHDLLRDPGDVNLYFHTKGVSKLIGDPYKNAEKIWDALMCRFVIACPDICISGLRSHDAVGMMFTHAVFNHFPGNFWWCTGDHLRRLRRVIDFSETHNRFYAESIIGRISGKYMSTSDIPDRFDFYHNNKYSDADFNFKTASHVVRY